MSFRNRFYLFVAVITGFPLVGIGFAFRVQEQSGLEEQIGLQSLELARVYMIRAQEDALIGLDNARMWAGTPQVRALGKGTSGDLSLLADLIALQQHLSYIAVTDHTGRVVWASIPRLKGRLLSSMPRVHEALQGKESVEVLQKDTLTRSATLAYAVPIMGLGDGAKQVGALLAGMSWSEFTEHISGYEIRGMPQSESNHIMLTNNEGLVISCFSEEEIFTDNLISIGMDSAKKAQGRQEGFTLETSEHGLKSFTAYTYAKPYRNLPDLGWLMVLLQDPDLILPAATLSDQVLLVLALLITFVLGVAIFFAKRLTAPISQLATAANAIGKGDFDVPVGVASGTDEIGRLAEAIVRLKAVSSENQIRDWQKTGVARLSDVVSGEKPISKLADEVVSEVCTYLDAKIGALYVLEEKGEAPLLTLQGSYAYTEGKNLSNRFKLGESMVGQSAVEKKQLLIRNVPADYVRVSSGLGETLPRFICVTPLIHDERVKGVLEIGTLEEMSNTQLEYLNQAMPAVAVTLDGARSRQELAQSLRQSQQLSEELLAQQEELRTSNEELEEQTQALQRSEEKLKAQQEELQVINEELEEKNDSLVVQKQEVELAQGAIQQKAEELAIASKYKSEFLANMSHELRTPLNSLLLLARSLADNKDGNLTGDQKESAQIIYGSGTDLLALINEILDLSKIEAGQMELQVEDVALADLADTMRVSFGHMAAEAELVLDVEITGDAPETIATDSKRVQQVLKNLISNSLKFTEQGSISIRFARPSSDVDLGRSGLDSRHAVAISVVDTGIGIPADQQKIIFEAFQQVDGTTARKYGGTGLGLSISREIAVLLGGEIQLQSTMGQGSTFTLYLPIGAPAPSEEAASDTAARIQGLSEPTQQPSRKRALLHETVTVPDDRDDLTSKDKSILIIEDDVTFVGVLLRQCHDRGFKCLVATTGEDGLELARQHVPNAVILDLELPTIDGWRVLERLKEDTSLRHIPVHIISVEEPSTMAFRKGAIGHLRKPVTEDGLRGVLARIESSFSSQLKSLLVVEDNKDARRAIVKLVSGQDVKIDEASGAQEAIEAILAKRYDCMILDLGLWDMDGDKLLEAIDKDEDAELPPVIVYTGKELSREQEMLLREYTESIILKDVRSEERLLDEVSLFLHRVVSDMPPKKRQVIINLHDTDALFEGKSVLIVEDDMRSAFAMAKLLSDRGMTVTKVENGHKALEHLEKSPNVDLVLMDIMMPVMDGHETMKRIRAQKRFEQLPIIALTAKAMRGDMEKCIEAGANDYLAKPIDQQRLLSMMRVWLYG